MDNCDLDLQWWWSYYNSHNKTASLSKRTSKSVMLHERDLCWSQLGLHGSNLTWGVGAGSRWWLYSCCSTACTLQSKDEMGNGPQVVFRQSLGTWHRIGDAPFISWLCIAVAFELWWRIFSGSSVRSTNYIMWRLYSTVEQHFSNGGSQPTRGEWAGWVGEWEICKLSALSQQIIFVGVLRVSESSTDCLFSKLWQPVPKIIPREK